MASVQTIAVVAKIADKRDMRRDPVTVFGTVDTV
jgi:hypothetical protein